MKNSFIFLIILLFFKTSNAQTDISLTGMRFEEFTKANGSSTVIEFKSNTRAVYIMSGVSPFSGRSFKDICPCTSSVDGNKIKIKCNCEDKEIYPDPIEDKFVFDKNKKQLISTKYQYTNGSAPSPELAWKYVLWNLR